MKRFTFILFALAFVLFVALFGMVQSVHAAPALDGPVVTNPQEFVNALLPIFVAVLFAFFAGGATIATLIALVLNMVLKSPVLISFLEKLYEGLSPSWQAAIKDADKLIDQVTDGVPTGEDNESGA